MPAHEVEHRPQEEADSEPESEPEPEPEIPPEPRQPRIKKTAVKFEIPEAIPRARAAAPKLAKSSQSEAIPTRATDHRRVTRGKLELLVKYKGFPTPSWQPITNFKFGGQFHPVIQAYLDAHPRLQA